MDRLIRRMRGEEGVALIIAVVLMGVDFGLVALTAGAATARLAMTASFSALGRARRRQSR